MPDQSLIDYLKRVDRLQDQGFVFGANVSLEAVLTAMEEAFPGRFVFTLRAHGPIPPTEDEVYETFQNSFVGGGVLAVAINEAPPLPVVRAVERMVADRYLPRRHEGRETLKPPPEWRMVLVALVADPAALPGGLASLFPARLAI